ncbi:hypothetical protein PDL68_23115 [Bacillus cereus]|nr:hypothetical protein [Bacillus cereus]MDA1925341.1 hypothetical protein [Bacillus cereus]
MGLGFKINAIVNVNGATHSISAIQLAQMAEELQELIGGFKI